MFLADWHPVTHSRLQRLLFTEPAAAAALIEKVVKPWGLTNSTPETAAIPISLAFRFRTSLPNPHPFSEVEEQHHFSSEMTCWEFLCLQWGMRFCRSWPWEYRALVALTYFISHTCHPAAQPLAGCLKGSQTARSGRKILQGPWEAATHWMRSSGLWILILTSVICDQSSLSPCSFFDHFFGIICVCLLAKW